MRWQSTADRHHVGAEDDAALAGERWPPRDSWRRTLLVPLRRTRCRRRAPPSACARRRRGRVVVAGVFTPPKPPSKPNPIRVDGVETHATRAVMSLERKRETLVSEVDELAEALAGRKKRLQGEAKVRLLSEKKKADKKLEKVEADLMAKQAAQTREQRHHDRVRADWGGPPSELPVTSYELSVDDVVVVEGSYRPVDADGDGKLSSPSVRPTCSSTSSPATRSRVTALPPRARARSPAPRRSAPTTYHGPGGRRSPVVVAAVGTKKIPLLPPDVPEDLESDWLTDKSLKLAEVDDEIEIMWRLPSEGAPVEYYELMIGSTVAYKGEKLGDSFVPPRDGSKRSTCSCARATRGASAWTRSW